MTTSPDSSENKNTYFIDSEGAAEMARLLDQDVLVTNSMGGLFPERAGSDTLEGIHDILDVACGPGGWALNVCLDYPDTEVTGIDSSEMMVLYARAHAKARRLDNVRFKVMDAMKPLEFPDASFDLVNSRALVGLMTPQTWPQLVREMVRVCRPGGTIRLTEFEMPMTTSPAFEKISDLILRAMQKVGRTYSPDGRYFTLTPMLGSLLRDAGCVSIEKKPHILDFSSGTEAHDGYSQDLILGFGLVLPFLLHIEPITHEGVKKELFEQTLREMMSEMQAEDFCAFAYGATVWGRRP
ncbi:MAG: class I SAM-dependent methyltransferase [Ktedonobacteraceae bacterium]